MEPSISVQDAEDVVMESTGVLPKDGGGIFGFVGGILLYVAIIAVLTLLGFCLETYVFLREPAKEKCEIRHLYLFKRYYHSINPIFRTVKKAFEETFPLGLVLVLLGLMSSNFRLLIYLTLPGMCSGTGQSILCCIISACMFNGPFDNIYKNFDMVQISLGTGLQNSATKVQTVP